MDDVMDTEVVLTPLAKKSDVTLMRDFFVRRLQSGRGDFDDLLSDLNELYSAEEIQTVLNSDGVRGNPRINFKHYPVVKAAMDIEVTTTDEEEVLASAENDGNYENIPTPMRMSGRK
ncbi:MAG TPA: hypothetical protein VGV92_02970 [Gammaproteobacteria bacterium]|nr:hypothetical protein [Gammaproteobacteria bacterium]